MKIILQRVTSANVVINGTQKREISKGAVLFLGISPTDNESISNFMAEKTANLRIFGDENGDMNLSLLDIGGEVLLISNFTLYANSRKGRRPSFSESARPDQAEPLYQHFAKKLGEAGAKWVEMGEFGADMAVTLTNDGPVTIILESDVIMLKKET